MEYRDPKCPFCGVEFPLPQGYEIDKPMPSPCGCGAAVEFIMEMDEAEQAGALRDEGVEDVRFCEPVDGLTDTDAGEDVIPDLVVGAFWKQ